MNFCRYIKTWEIRQIRTISLIFPSFSNKTKWNNKQYIIVSSASCHSMITEFFQGTLQLEYNLGYYFNYCSIVGISFCYYYFCCQCHYQVLLAIKMQIDLNFRWNCEYFGCLRCSTVVNVILLHLGEQMAVSVLPSSSSSKKYINFKLERNISGVKNSIHHPTNFY